MLYFVYWTVCRITEEPINKVSWNFETWGKKYQHHHHCHCHHYHHHYYCLCFNGSFQVDIGYSVSSMSVFYTIRPTSPYCHSTGMEQSAISHPSCTLTHQLQMRWKLKTFLYHSGYLPPWLSGLAISGRGAVKAWLAIRQGVGSTLAPVGMSSQVSAWDYSRARYKRVCLCPR